MTSRTFSMYQTDNLDALLPAQKIPTSFTNIEPYSLQSGFSFNKSIDMTRPEDKSVTSQLDVTPYNVISDTEHYSETHDQPRELFFLMNISAFKISEVQGTKPFNLQFTLGTLRDYIKSNFDEKKADNNKPDIEEKYKSGKINAFGFDGNGKRDPKYHFAYLLGYPSAVCEMFRFYGVSTNQAPPNNTKSKNQRSIDDTGTQFDFSLKKRSQISIMNYGVANTILKLEIPKSFKEIDDYELIELYENKKGEYEEYIKKKKSYESEMRDFNNDKVWVEFTEKEKSSCTVSIKKNRCYVQKIDQIFGSPTTQYIGRFHFNIGDSDYHDLRFEKKNNNNTNFQNEKTILASLRVLQ